MGSLCECCATRAQWSEVEDGIFWDARPEGLSAVEVAGGSSGSLAGIKAGDYITHINGELMYGYTLDEAVEAIRKVPAVRDAWVVRLPPANT